MQPRDCDRRFRAADRRTALAGTALVRLATAGAAGLVRRQGVLGGGQFLLAPSGDVVGLSTAELAGSPFRDSLIPGLVLCWLLGVVPLVVAPGVYRGRPWAWVGTVLVAVVPVVRVAVEGFVIGFGERLQYPNLLGAVGMLLVANARSVRASFRE